MGNDVVEGAATEPGLPVLAHEPLPGRWEQFAELLAQGYGYTEATAKCGVSPERARDWLGRRETAQRVVYKVRQAMEIGAGKAVRVLSDSLSAESERVRLEAALAILDRSGVGKTAETTSPVSIVIDLSS
jgi:hypothetical protein